MKASSDVVESAGDVIESGANMNPMLMKTTAADMTTDNFIFNIIVLY